jgi:PTS system galactitol-specific IIC component
MPISDKTRELVSRKFKGKTIHIGMSPALVIGHPTTLVCSVLLIPVILVMAVILPGNQFLPVASLAGIFYVFPMILPYTKGNVVKTFIIGLIAIVIGLLFVTDMGKDFQSAANDVFANTGDKAAKIEEYKDKVTGKMVQYEAGALDFASSLFSWVIYKFTSVWKYFGAGILTLITFGMLLWNRHRIVTEEKANKQNQA